MQKDIKVSLMVLILGLAVVWAGCGGPTTEPRDGAGEAVVTPGGAAPTMNTSAGQITNVLVPDWFLNIPSDPSYMYAVAMGSSSQMDMAMLNAKNDARTDLTNQLEVKVSGMFKRFREEVGAGEDAEYSSMSTAVSKEVYSEVLSGAKLSKQEILQEGKQYKNYVLFELPIAAINAAVIDKVKANKNMYTRFKASQGFKELESEVEKYEQWKKEQGQ